MSWLFGQSDQGGAAAGRSPGPPAPVESGQPLNRWEQDYLRAAGGGDFLRDDVETGFSGGEGPSATTSAAAYHRQTSSPDRAPGSPARGGPTLAELARSVSDANVYYSQRPPSRPLPTAPETSPWVDSDAGGAMRLRQSDGAGLQDDPPSQLSPQNSLEPLTSPLQVQVTMPCWSAFVCHAALPEHVSPDTCTDVLPCSIKRVPTPIRALRAGPPAASAAPASSA
jgi:hypothetical protein